jgi:quercetin 2,3-dioxygenase
MITLRRAMERLHEGGRRRATWLTFNSPRDRAGTPSDGWADIESLTEWRLAPRVGISRASVHDIEVLTYVHEGTLAFENSLGSSGVVQAGEFQCLTAGCGLQYSHTNASRTDTAKFFQIGLRPWELDLDPGHEQKRFTAAQRHGGLCIVASHDARSGSLRVHQDAQIYSALLDPGLHVVHELAPGRCEWLHIVRGEVALDDTVLTTGDGAGITAERAIAFTAREQSEILLVDLGTHHFERPGADPDGRQPSDWTL